MPEPKKPRRPGTTPEARERQLVAMAVDLVEQRLLDGTASAQETMFYLKLGSSREKLEQERISLENLMTKAKTDQIAADVNKEKMFAEAIEAMRSYKGQRDDGAQRVLRDND